MSYARLTDAPNLKRHLPDFLPRYYGIHNGWFLSALVLGALAIITTCKLFNAASLILIIPIISLVFSALAALILANNQRLNDIVMAIEFQNSLFAGVMRLGYEFCVIIKEDGALVYADDLFQRHFLSTGQSDYNLETILQSFGLSAEQVAYCKRSLTDGKTFSFPVSLPATQGHHATQLTLHFMNVTLLDEDRDLSKEDFIAHPAHIAMKPLHIHTNILARPHGYYIIRAAAQLSVQEETLDMLQESWLEYASLPVFAIAPDTSIQYVNAAFAAWLGHPPTTLHGTPLSIIQDLPTPLRTRLTQQRFIHANGMKQEAPCLPFSITATPATKALEFFVLFPQPELVEKL